MNCSHCSAKIPSDALTCPYCGHETPNFAAARAHEAEKTRHAQQQAQADASTARQASLGTLEGSAKVALYWALAGVLVCCLPIGSIGGLVLGSRVRKSAAALGVPAPWQSLAALIVSAGTLSLLVLALIIGVISDREKTARVAALREATKASGAAAELEVETACALVEVTLLEGGAGQKGGALNLFRCEGALEREPGGAAVLRDVEYARLAGADPARVDACLSKGTRWKVDAIGTGPGCRTGADAGE